MVININQRHSDISGLVKNLSTIRPVSDEQQQIDARKKKLLQYVQEEVLHVTSLNQIEAAERIFAPLKPTLAAVKSQDQSSTNLTMTSSSNTPHNKNIQPQRRLFATKQCRKKKKALKKPSAEEADVLAIHLLHRE